MFLPPFNIAKLKMYTLYIIFAMYFSLHKKQRQNSARQAFLAEI